MEDELTEEFTGAETERHQLSAMMVKMWHKMDAVHKARPGYDIDDTASGQIRSEE